MLHKIKIIFCFLYLSLNTLSAQQNWEMISFRDGGNSIILAVDSADYIYNVVKVRSWGKNSIFRSDNDGISWKQIGRTQDTLIYNLSVTSKGDLLIATCNGVALSTDHGETWKDIAQALPFKNVTSFVCTSDDVFLAGTSFPLTGYSLYKSTNYGSSWVPIENFTSGIILILHSNNLLIISSVNDQYLKTSADAGNTWVETNYSRYFIVQAKLVFNKKTGQTFCSLLLEGGSYYHTKIITSADTGKTWNAISWPDNLECNDIKADNHGNLWISSYGQGLLKSTDNGAGWKTYNNMNNVFLNTLVIDSRRNYIYAGSDLGVIKSTDNGNNWIEITSGLNSVKIENLFNDHNRGLIISCKEGCIKYSEEDNSYVTLNKGLNEPQIVSILNAGADFFAAELFSGSISDRSQGYKLNAAISEWEKVNGLFYEIAAHPNGSLYSIYSRYDGHGPFYYFYQSVDQGFSWNRIPMTNSPIKIRIDSRGIIYFVDHGYGILKSIDGGKNFNKLGIVNFGIRDFLIDNKDRLYVLTNYNELLLSKAGNEWNNISGNLPEGYIDKVSLDKFGRIYVIFEKKRIYLKKAEGDSWIDITSNLSVDDLNDIVLAGDSSLYVSTVSGLIYKTDQALDSVPVIPSETSGYYLSQNYPNPFNPATKINYKIQTSSFVRIKLYDILGSEAAVIVDEYKDPGEYNIEFDAAGLPGGVYFYRLESENYSDSKKLIILR